MLQHSAFCRGSVRHRRHMPKSHEFEYKTGMAWIDLDELHQLESLPFWSVERFNLVQYKRKDYLSPQAGDLKQAVYQKLQANGVDVIPGKVFLLTQLRSWGFSFNPVSFYFCVDQHNQLYAIAAEITNTPWLERHTYVLPTTPQTMNGQPLSFTFSKQFHVSPFMPMALQYDWRFRISDEEIMIYMKLEKQQEHVFDANLRLKKAPLSNSLARQVAITYPLACLKTVAAIYWQALRLWLKRIPFYEHPGRKPDDQIDKQHSQLQAKPSESPLKEVS